ncbi:hypothetical protein [Dactylosporangium sp. NPDC050588]|uniref:hypothetical protein n=1 Tax=Dactylosporangium sp. NPDC050588 TaxID=3157211 RepID=UPI0033D09FBD
MRDPETDALALLHDLVRIDSVNPGLVPSAAVATRADFRSTDPTVAEGARQADGRLPLTDFLQTS